MLRRDRPRRSSSPPRRCCSSAAPFTASSGASAASRFPTQAEGSLIRRADGTSSARASSPSASRGRILPPAPLGGGLRRRVDRRQQLRHVEPGPAPPVRERLDAVRARDGVHGGAGADRAGHGQRVRSRSPPHPARDRRPGGAGGAGARRQRRSRACAGRGHTSSRRCGACSALPASTSCSSTWRWTTPSAPSPPPASRSPRP